MDETREVNSNDPKREKFRVIPLSAIDDAPDHPFGVRDDEEMAELMESISTFGVINPVIVRRTDNERYEMISGHRRKYACTKLGITKRNQWMVKHSDLLIAYVKHEKGGASTTLHLAKKLNIRIINVAQTSKM